MSIIQIIAIIMLELSILPAELLVFFQVYSLIKYINKQNNTLQKQIEIKQVEINVSDEESTDV